MKSGKYLKITTLHLPEPYLKALDVLIQKKLYYCKGDAIREAVRRLIEEEFQNLGLDIKEFGIDKNLKKKK
ncbi:MAG: ribbon-helix-helix domain-containing protein [Nitrososphaerota archaeon]